MKINEIYNVDCIEGMERLDDNSIDMILTDIPYGEVNKKSNGLRKMGHFDKGNANTITFDIEVFLKECVRVCSGCIYIFCGSEQVSSIRRYFIEQKMSTRHCIWEKTNPAPINGKHIWLSGIENCIYAKKSGATHNVHCKNTVWRFPNGRGKQHPTEKPLKLFEFLIEASSNEEMLILDPCLGSGTTAVAAKKLNRNYIGFELDKEYFNLAQKRILEE